MQKFLGCKIKDIQGQRMRDAQEMARGLHIEEDRDGLRLIEMDLRGLLWTKM